MGIANIVRSRVRTTEHYVRVSKVPYFTLESSCSKRKWQKKENGIIVDYYYCHLTPGAVIWIV